MEENHATNETRFATNLVAIRKEVERSHDDFITEHFHKYNEPDLLPVWKTLEVISMGTLSKLYSNFSDATAKHAVTREFGLNHHNFFEKLVRVPCRVSQLLRPPFKTVQPCFSC